METLDLVLLVVLVVLAVGIVWVSYLICQLYSRPEDFDEGDMGMETQALEKSRSFRIRLSDLTLGPEIGSGFLGAVNSGTYLNMPVAFKELDFGDAKVDLDTITEEFRPLGDMRHPSLTLLMGIAFPSDRSLALVWQHMSRGCLHDAVRDKSLALDWKARVTMALDVTRALYFLHSKKAPYNIHGALHTHNVLIDSDRSAYLCDYGMYALRKRQGLYTTYVHTAFRAPEVLRKGKYNQASDIYSLGMVMYTIFTRCEPFSAAAHETYQAERTQSDEKSNSKHAEVLAPSAAAPILENMDFAKAVISGARPYLPKSLPSSLRELLMLCWRHEPSKRPETDAIITVLEGVERARVDVLKLGEVKQAPTDKELTLQRRAVERNKQLRQLKRCKWLVQFDEIMLEELIGDGSFGEVWAGTFRGKQVAVKMLTKGKLRDDKLDDFIHELNVMCSLRHPSTVLFMGACLEPDSECIIMELCEKGNLFDLLHDKSIQFDYNRILHVLREISEGLMYLHSSSPPILHRDLKSLNILVDADWNVKVSDFGLTDFKADMYEEDGRAEGVKGRPGSAAVAKKKTDDSEKNAGKRKKKKAVELGTPFWLAPEVMEKQEFSEASDVYSFGMIAWEMFAREVPFKNMTPHQAALAVVKEDRRPAIPSFVPPKFRDMILACWSRQPQERPKFSQIVTTIAMLKEEGLPRLDLSLENAMLYRKRTKVYAFPSRDTVTVYKSWGCGESKKYDYVIVGPNHDVYTCDKTIFHETYQQHGKHPQSYRKVGKVLAKEMKDDFLIETLEGMEHGSAGDFLAQNPVKGEQWPIFRKTFLNMYEECPVQRLDPGMIGYDQQEAAEEKKEY